MKKAESRNNARPWLSRRLVVLVFLLFFFAAIFNDSWLLLRAAYFIAGAGLLGFLWTRLNNPRGAQARFEVSAAQVQAGERPVLTLSVENSSPLPRLWLEVTLPSSAPDLSFQKVLSLRGYDEKKWSWPMPSLKRGLYNLGPLNITARDPFRFHGQMQTYRETKEILVYPRAEDLPFFDPYLEKKQAMHSSRTAWNYLSYQAGGIRSYVHGDSLRRVHWPSTAKAGKLMVKVLDSTTSYQVWLVLDMQQDVHSKDGESEEHLVEAAASLAKKFLEAGLAVGLLYYSRERHFVPAARHQDHLWNILRSLAVAQATGRVPITQVIQREAPLLVDGFSVTLITPTTEPALVQTVDDLRNKGCSPRVLLEEPTASSTKGPSPLATSLWQKGVVIYRLAAGQPLAEALDDRNLVAANRTFAGVV